MNDPISPEELKHIKDNCLLWGNNCGGCETCTQFFGTKEPLYDHQETYMLILMIENRNRRIVELESSWLVKFSCMLNRFLLQLRQYSMKGRKYE
jgi:hypothetical protein